MKELGMEMRAWEEVGAGEDLLSPLSPIVFSLYDPLLNSHCSSCALPLSFATSSLPSLFFCSDHCSAVCAPSAAAESSLLRRRRSLPAPFSTDSSDLRAALRLLLLSRLLRLSSSADRVGGLLCNSNVFKSLEIRAAALAIAEAVADRGEGGGGRVSEEEALCVVLTNAVEVQSRCGTALGIAVYDTPFSWINHSCSPNTCYRFSEPSRSSSARGRLAWSAERRIAPPRGRPSASEFVKCFEGNMMESCGPAIIVRSIRPIRKGEEVTITYVDLLKNKAARRSELYSKYGFLCSCVRCASSPPCYVDTLLQEMTILPFTGGEISSDIHGELSNYVEKTVSDYLSSDDPELCCARLEYFLMQTSGFRFPSGEFGGGGGGGDGGVSSGGGDGGGWAAAALLHPCHHLCLDAYTVLASVYKLRHSSLDPHRMTALDLSRTASGFSLLLAGMVNHLLLSEPSIVMSAAGFWTDAGRSLLELADKVGTCEEDNADLCKSVVGFSGEWGPLMERVVEIAGAVWYFLARGCPYLELVRNPVVLDERGPCSERGCGSVKDGISELGSLCFAYGRHLSNLCFGPKFSM